MGDVLSSFPGQLQGVLDSTVARLRAAGTDLQSVEVKRASGGFPRSALDSVCAFANARGGLLILGLTDGDFEPVPVDAAKLAADLASSCSTDLDPPIRPEIDIVLLEGRPVVVAQIDALEHQRRPCFLRRDGMERGAYLRTHDGDRRMNSYEVHIMVSGRGQPDDDMVAVEKAHLGDLDSELTEALLRRLRERRGLAFQRVDDGEVLHMLGALTAPRADAEVTLAGLLALGRYPQQFFPQLGASFVSMPTTSGEPTSDGTRFLDNRPLDGPIPAIVSGALDALRQNMRRRSVIIGAGRVDVWDYPVEAVREIVANALTHRDYHPTAHGSQVRVALYPDRLEVSNIGGLHGPNAGQTDVEELISRGITATRNARLAKLLEDVVIPDSGRPVCENRGSGLRAAVAVLRQAGMPPLAIFDDTSELRVVIYNRRTSDDDEGSVPSDPVPPLALELTGRESEIVQLLFNGPRRSSELARDMGISQQAVLKWLKVLSDRGMVSATEPNPRTRKNRWRLISQ
ncbi:RNA-binding domain-containing protein [Candidatus Poriferisocius sp.]|uniref:RNA-binding domain-containing protein n=1 Tax=Candidatus Poriferisocius sp. TaxID=3101276 RepID=UPI003B013F5F